MSLALSQHIQAWLDDSQSFHLSGQLKQVEDSELTVDVAETQVSFQHYWKRAQRKFYFFFSFGCDEACYLCIMAFDRYLAICHPLHYPRIMTKDLYTGLAIFGWSCGLILFVTPVILISRLPYCGPNIINHFVCDPVPLMNLSCSEDTTTQLIYSTLNVIFMIGTFIFVLCSYFLVILAVLRMTSSASKRKAFSTCASHLSVVILFFGSVMMMHVNIGSEHSVKMQKIVTLFYSVITPLCNPLIYSLRNKEMIAALRKIFRIK
ncbi:olfactory receptor 11H1-like [Orycteropus afer afer]|uniref:Olfactory receptor 11H1-like n=1 Tax=Orycteropus afer afer TaxID=1230840 RepID=A0AC54ZDR0_ORYAF|nr:olfactory receptor 11H1-like [Orycteropus afer afer]